MGKLPDISSKHLTAIEILTREGCMPLEGSFILTTVSADIKLRPRLSAQVQSFICRYSVGIRVELSRITTLPHRPPAPVQGVPRLQQKAGHISDDYYL